MEQLTKIQAIKKFFDMSSQDCMKEYKALSEEEKQWFGEECCKALGCELKAGPS